MKPCRQISIPIWHEQYKKKAPVSLGVFTCGDFEGFFAYRITYVVSVDALFFGYIQHSLGWI